MNPSETLQKSVPPVLDPPACSNLPRKPPFFSADSLLKVVDCDIPESGVHRSRQNITVFILKNVNEMLTKLQRAYTEVYLHYVRLMRSDPPVADEEIRKAGAVCFARREILVEASMSAKYFNVMLPDLERSRRSMDLLSLKVPNHAARLDDYLCATEEIRRAVSTQRTYYSRIPAILRQLPDTSPTHEHASLPDIADALSNLTLAESSEQRL